jgi:hypothetical protein
MRIGLFVPCYIDTFFPEVGIATLGPCRVVGHRCLPLWRTFLTIGGVSRAWITV